MRIVAIALLTISCAFGAEIDGSGIFKTRCSIGYCHGSEGKPGRAPKLRERDFTGDYLMKVVTDGIPSSSMPAFKELLKPQEITAVVNYVLSLSGKPPVQKAAPAEAPSTANFDKGKALFFDAANENNCGVCHAVDGAGTAIGPDLRKLKRTRAELIAAIENPPQSKLTKVTLKNGDVIQGIPAPDSRIWDTEGLPPVLRNINRDEIAKTEMTQGQTMPKAQYSKDQLNEIVSYILQNER
ncbi:MAG: c-type cytochrome [Bryobacteraceae bacterium]